MKKWLTLVLALAICLVPFSAFALDYPVESDETLIMWKVLDGSIAEGGYTTSNETPGFIEWQRATGIKVDIQEYTDYVVPNNVVDDGTLNANYFQHIPYLEDFNAENGTHLVSVVPIHVEPMGIYGGKQASLDVIGQ